MGGPRKMGVYPLFKQTKTWKQRVTNDLMCSKDRYSKAHVCEEGNKERSPNLIRTTVTLAYSKMLAYSLNYNTKRPAFGCLFNHSLYYTLIH